MPGPHESSMNVGGPSVLTPTDLFSRIADDDPIFLLGAGTSVKSGIPASADMVRMAMRWLYAYQQGWATDDLRITASDVQTLMQQQLGLEAGRSPADAFPRAIALLSQPR